MVPAAEIRCISYSSTSKSTVVMTGCSQSSSIFISLYTCVGLQLAEAELTLNILYIA